MNNRCIFLYGPPGTNKSYFFDEFRYNDEVKIIVDRFADSEYYKEYKEQYDKKEYEKCIELYLDFYEKELEKNMNEEIEKVLLFHSHLDEIENYIKFFEIKNEKKLKEKLQMIKEKFHIPKFGENGIQINVPANDEIVFYSFVDEINNYYIPFYFEVVDILKSEFFDTMKKTDHLYITFLPCIFWQKQCDEDFIFNGDQSIQTLNEYYLTFHNTLEEQKN